MKHLLMLLTISITLLACEAEPGHETQENQTKTSQTSMADNQNTLPAAYPDDWRVQFESAGPLRITPKLPIPFDGTDDGYYREPAYAERYYGPDPGTKEYPVGFQTHVGGPKLKVALRKDQDVPITLRDGTVIYADVFRAADTPADAKLPTILSWSIYGKTTPKDVHYYKRYFRNVPLDLTSGFAQAEGPDPAYWTQYGYAVLNVDQRGVNKSGGDIHWWGSVARGDAHDVINWISEQPWSNGKVGLSGVSYYGVQQWDTASSDAPEALAAIAPRAHWNDSLRHWLRIGGISNTALARNIAMMVMGENKHERLDLMADGQPLMNEYWDDKDSKVEDITIPVYQVAGPALFSSAAYTFLPEGNKWLRFAPSYHLEDYYTEAALSTERRFFDRYLKDIDNGWEQDMPRVSIEVTKAGFGAAVEKIREDSAWPLENTVYKKLYLDLDKGKLVDTTPSKQAEVRYDGKTGKTILTYTFEKDTDVIGFMKLKLWVQAEGVTNDMDVYAAAFKISESPGKRGAILDPSLAPHSTSTSGAAPMIVGSGQLRVSLRELDPKRSTDWLPVPALKEHQFLDRDEIVPIEIAMRAAAMAFDAGDQLRLEIGGNVFAPKVGTDTRNSGNHVILSGAEMDSYFQIPIAPEE